MGGYLQSEFSRVLKAKNRLYLDQVKELQPPQDVNLDLRHIPTLWKLDANHDGCVTFQELEAFAELSNETRRIHGLCDFQAKLKADCTVELWHLMREQRG